MKSFDISGSWLIDPNNKWAIHFDSNLNSVDNLESKFSIDMWGLDSDGNPLNFKSRRKASIKDTLKTWNQLLSSHWTKTRFKKVEIS